MSQYDYDPPFDQRVYWVLWGNTWRIAMYAEGFWWFIGSEVPKTKEDVHRWEGPLIPPAPFDF